jgi:hypothetical protein
MQNLLSNMKIDAVGALVAAALNTDLRTTIVDMSGYDGVLWIAEIAVTANTAVATFVAEGAAVNVAGSMVALTGATCTVTDAGGAAYNNSLLVIDVYRPLLRFQCAHRYSTIANVTFGPVIAIRYRGKSFPITQTATITGVVASAAVQGV